MAERWNLKRLTRVDVLVAGAVCLLLVALVPMLLAKSREQSIRRLCAANLSQIGKTMLIYANDHEGALPRAGGPTTIWGPTPNWTAVGRYTAFDIHFSHGGGSATISSSFYLLVKYYEAPTRLFICRGNKGTTEFKLSDIFTDVITNFELADAWDFGPMSEAFKHCSYSYHIPYGPFALTTSRGLNLAVAADRNPFLSSPMADAALVGGFKPDLDMFRGTPEQASAGNAITHGRDGQNVLFLDGRVTFEKRSYCGVESDNIYLTSLDVQRGSPIGCVPLPRMAQPGNDHDSVLVHDPDVWGLAGPPWTP
jgi:hypothetical protein